jgi:tetratricopeptide (TPR) repeat protein
MAKKVIKTQSDTGFEGIEQALTKSERFIESNQKLLLNIIIGIVAAVLIVIGVKRLYLAPMSEDAARDMYMAERFFEKDSFNLALNGLGTYPGFLQIIEDYKFTKSAKLARYYAGVSFLQLGEYEEAIKHLKKFRTSDLLIRASWNSSMGDAYIGLNDYGNAAKYYIAGAEKNENNFTSPFLLKKAAVVYEEMGDYGKALEAYKEIKRSYPDSQEGREIEKYIGRAELMLSK